MHNPLDDPVPEDPIQRVHALALDLAYGAAHGRWPSRFFVVSHIDGRFLWPLEVQQAIGGKWGMISGNPLPGLSDRIPDMSLLFSYQYVQRLDTDQESVDERMLMDYIVSNPSSEHPIEAQSFFSGYSVYVLTDKAFALLEQPAPASIFISYRRQDSSELAQLVLARFKMLGQQPFLDLDIEPGDDWDTRIRREVTEREYFVSLVGPTTLESAYVRQEILWALDAGAQIIPIWHRGFGDAQLAYLAAQYPDLDAFFARQAIRVERENPIAYEGAIIQLLNHFGFTPS